MKRNLTIRQILLPILFLAAGIPIALFAMVFQKRMSDSVSDSIDRQIVNNLERANDILDMVLEKYDDMMYELCTDNEFIAILENINNDGDSLDVGKEAIENELCRMCNWEEPIKGITIITEKRKVIYYDELEDSSVHTMWADENKFRQKGKGVFYRGVHDPVGQGDNQKYIFQISRNFVDRKNMEKNIGTVIFSIDVSALDPVLRVGENSKSCILKDGRIIADQDYDRIGERLDIDRIENYRCEKMTNIKSGFTVLNMYTLDTYNEMREDQTTFWLVLAVCLFVFLSAFSYFLTKPYLDQIKLLSAAMSEVEKGDFRVKIPEFQTGVVEIRNIAVGFNKMVKQIDILIDQVKNAVVEQKNAELSALEAQIDPHFLYNTLDTINWKAIENDQYDISEMYGALADILRYTVRSAGEETTIGEEIDWMQKYILLQEGKLEQEPEVSICVPKELYEYRIHKLLLQPFIENAMKHGFSDRDGQLKLTLIMKEMGGQIHITIQDNGNGIEEEKLKILNDKQAESYLGQRGEHLGVINVRKRLMLYYGDKAELYFESQAGSYTKVHLFIPVRSDSETEAEKEGKEESDEDSSGGR